MNKNLFTAGLNGHGFLGSFDACAIVIAGSVLVAIQRTESSYNEARE